MGEDVGKPVDLVRLTNIADLGVTIGPESARPQPAVSEVNPRPEGFRCGTLRHALSVTRSGNRVCYRSKGSICRPMCSVKTGGIAWVSSSRFIQSMPMTSAAIFHPAVCPIPGALPFCHEAW